MMGGTIDNQNNYKSNYNSSKNININNNNINFLSPCPSNNNY